MKPQEEKHCTCLCCWVVTLDFRGGVFLSTVLQSYLLSTLNVRVSDENLSSFMMLHAALWSYVSLETFNAVS
jgi:hypothetical protein